jgi:HEAT repeat protein
VRDVKLLGASGNPAAAADALALLPDSEGALRQAIVEMAARVKPAGSEAALRDLLDAAEHTGDRALALAGLAEVASTTSQASILPHLADEDALVRANAARALGRLADDDVAAALRSRLRTEKDERVRRELTIALGAQGQPVDIADLRRCLAQPIRRIERAICLEALAAAPDPAAAAALIGILTKPDSDLRREAAMGLGARPEDVARTALLSAAEKEEDPAVVRFIVTSLGKLKEARGKERLKAGLEDPNVALYCALTLAELGDATGAAILRVALRDRDYRERALVARAKLKDDETPALIEKHCSKESRPRVRALAIEVLASLPGT